MPLVPTNAIKTIGAQLLGRAGLWCLKAEYPTPEAGQVAKLRTSTAPCTQCSPFPKPWKDFRGGMASHRPRLEGEGPACAACVPLRYQAAFHAAGLKFFKNHTFSGGFGVLAKSI